MSEERKNHYWPLIVALLIGLPVLYVASYGPACWYWSRHNEDPPGHMRRSELFEWAYLPICWCASREPRLLAPAISWYATLGMPEDRCVYIRQDPIVDDSIGMETE
jgi:hypothetical protein